MKVAFSSFVLLCLVVLSACRYSASPLNGRATLSASQYGQGIKGEWKLKEFHGPYFSDSDLPKQLERFASDGETIAFGNEKSDGNLFGKWRSMGLKNGRILIGDPLALDDSELHFEIEAMSENALLLKVTSPHYSEELSAQLKYARIAHDAKFVTFKQELAEQFATEFDEVLERWHDAKGEVCRWRTDLHDFMNKDLVASSGLLPRDTVIAISGTVTDIWTGCDSIYEEVAVASPKVDAAIHSTDGFTVLVERLQDGRDARRVLYNFRYED